MAEILYIVKNIFREERRNKSVIMGYLLGIAIIAYWLKPFLDYIQETGEPVNILEAFVVIEHYHNNVLFLVLGWLLTVSDAPFIRGNIWLVLCRSSRRKWNAGMLIFIMLQAFCYVACLAAVTVAASSFVGFVGNMWSSPVYDLAIDGKQYILMQKYHVVFGWENIMQNMTVPQAFGITALFLYLYMVFLGVLLYAGNLLLRKIYGVLLVFATHIGGYLLRYDGSSWAWKISLLAKTLPGNSIDGMGGEWATVFLFLGLILVVVFITIWGVRKVDFKEAVMEE